MKRWSCKNSCEGFYFSLPRQQIFKQIRGARRSVPWNSSNSKHFLLSRAPCTRYCSCFLKNTQHKSCFLASKTIRWIIEQSFRELERKIYSHQYSKQAFWIDHNLCCRQLLWSYGTSQQNEKPEAHCFHNKSIFALRIQLKHPRLAIPIGTNLIHETISRPESKDKKKKIILNQCIVTQVFDS